MAAQSKIVKRNSRWFVASADGDKILAGPYKSKEEAEQEAPAGKARARYTSTGFLALEPRAFGAEFDVAGGVPPQPFEEHGSVAVIRITGPLEQHPNKDFQDYETLRGQATAAFECPTTRAVALCINSPGGSAAGCFELARAMRAMSDESRKPLGVFVDGMAASAAYGLACAATPGLLHAPPTSTVASLAVYEMIVDQTAADAFQGLRFIFVPSSGADLKLTGSSHLVQTEEQFAHTQAQVDLLTDYFYELVTEMRADAGVSVESIQGLRGATLLATQGAAKGLVDVISDWDGFLTVLNSYQVNSMGAQAKKAEDKVDEKSPWDEALSALMGAAEGDDEDKKSKAKKMLKALMSDDAEETKAKAEEEPAKEEPAAAVEEPKKEEPAAAGGEYFPKAAAASVSNEVALANRVQALEARIAAQAETSERASLLAKRPDFSSEVQKAYASLPLESLRVVVKTAPRITVSPTAAAAAAQPSVTPGKADGALPGLDMQERHLLSKFDAKGATPTQARVEGKSLVLENMTPADAAKRVAELQKNGDVPMGFKRADLDALMNRFAAGGK